MSVVRRDYIERMIEECAQALIQVVDLVRAGEFDPALLLLHRTVEVVLGPLRPAFERLDVSSAVSLLGPLELDRVRMYAALLGEEAAVRDLRGQAAKADECRRRAIELYVAVYLAGGRLMGADWERIAMYGPKIDVGTIDPRYREAFQRMVAESPHDR